MQPGGYAGYDRGLSVLDKYNLISEHTYRGRGSLLCQTQQGLKMIRPYTGSADRLEKVYELLRHLQEAGHKQLDQFLRNEEGSLITTDKDGISYFVKDWWAHRECDARMGSDVVAAVRSLAVIHRDMYLAPEEEPSDKDSKEEKTLRAVLGNEDLRLVYRRHNQELKKIREFIRKRRQKNSFEYMCLEHMPRYMIYAKETLYRLEQSDYEGMQRENHKTGSVCHNSCTQHNFLMAKDGAILVNFEHYCYDSHMADLAQFMRKVLEKHGWNQNLAEKIIKEYDAINPISQKEYEQLVIRLSYPEKFWKIMNFYYNNNKAFFSERSVDKLVQQMENEKNWLIFIKTLQG